MVANWIPFEDPAGGPNFYRFDDNADYYINIDNTGTGKPAIRYLFKFKTHTRNGNTFLYAAPGVKSITDPKLNVYQTYTVTRERYRNGRKVGQAVLARNLPVAPNNVGPKTFPNYNAVARRRSSRSRAAARCSPASVTTRSSSTSARRSTGSTSASGTGNQGGGKDDLAGYNVHSVVLQVPESQVTRDGKSVSGPAAAMP